MKRKLKVVKFKQRIDADRESVIEILEDLLVQAKEGNVTAIAVAFVRPNKAINTAHSDNTVGDAGLLLGAAALMQHRLLNGIEGDQ